MLTTFKRNLEHAKSIDKQLARDVYVSWKAGEVSFIQANNLLRFICENAESYTMR
jgi:transcriptional/translational regulatory protein YebC/TACO1